ncbi:hypothetical protein J1N35_011839 [Gossypium stocksii]|uniref:Transposase MuDR plant domain-containing protein n=1 Tax=Gossypium stocksii TaxID=47602 RepID=A0A9D3W338_9ROSI|nr:hypothetical protein J1N35_011839 [Gossypium stocksii]
MARHSLVDNTEGEENEEVKEDEKIDNDPIEEVGSDGAEVTRLGIKFNSKDAFVAAVKWYNIQLGVNFTVTCSWYNKYKANYTMLATGCPWKIMASVRKKPSFWTIQKFTTSHTCVVAVPVLITHVRNEFNYIVSYHKACLAKQKTLENMHNRWEKSYNELWQWCQVPE